MKKILFYTGIHAPFWTEFALAMGKYDEIDFRVAFSMSTLEDRGGHWRITTKNKVYYECSGPQTVLTWATNVFNSFQPDIVILNGIRGKEFSVAHKLAKQHKCIVGILAEQLGVSNRLKIVIKSIFYRKILQSLNPDFFLAVGLRAADFYHHFLPKSCDLLVFRYFQDLSAAFDIPDRHTSIPVRFVFSGRLIERNSIDKIIKAIIELNKVRHGMFSLCVAGDGPEASLIYELIASDSSYEKNIYFDKEFTDWNDRLRPFADADVLLVPAKHSGWGLVIPEALASGIPVITTRYVESARHYIDDMVNGILVEPTVESILSSLVFCIDNPNILKKMQLNCRKSAISGDVTYGAEILFNYLRQKRYL